MCLPHDKCTIVLVLGTGTLKVISVCAGNVAVVAVLALTEAVLSMRTEHLGGIDKRRQTDFQRG